LVHTGDREVTDLVRFLTIVVPVDLSLGAGDGSGLLNPDPCGVLRTRDNFTTSVRVLALKYNTVADNGALGVNPTLFPAGVAVVGVGDVELGFCDLSVLPDGA
jgi:hypothetical protein